MLQEDWQLLQPNKTAWGTRDEGWWEIKIRAESDERVGVTLRGRFPKVSKAIMAPDTESEIGLSSICSDTQRSHRYLA